ncbi:MAG: hypothetical protein LQ350_002557 [Teloschistes chrysophthalmus]|nr:MAG: hypothetical protein LQ350_002557 [Niorma chrysophthalma]
MAGTCAAIVEPAGASSQLSVVTAGLNQIDSTSVAMPAMPISTTPASKVESSAPAPTVSAQSNVASGPCDCSCLCPMAAFPVVKPQMAANTSQAADSSSSQPSTFQTMASTSVANKAAAVSPSVSSTTSSSAMAMASPSTTPTALTLKSISGPLPSVIVTDTSIVQVQQQKIQSPSFDINTYSLTTSVEVPVNFGRAVEPTARV